MLKKLSVHLVGLFVVLSFSVTAQSQNTVFEGDGISGGIFLGMTRAQLVEVSQEDSCATGGCSFRLPTIASKNFIRVTLTNDLVSLITVLDGDFVTSQTGTDLNDEPSVVADAYEAAGFNVERNIEGSRRRNPTFVVTVDEIGYELRTKRLCFRATCSWEGEHLISSPR